MSIIIAVLAGFAPVPGSPATSPAKPYDKCIDGSSTNPEWAGCGATELERLEKLLNDAWKKARSVMDDEQSRTDLLREQRAWLKFRDMSCTYYANGQFGREGQVLHYYGCRAAITEARIAALSNLYSMASH